MSARLERDSGSRRYRKELSADVQQSRHMEEILPRPTRMAVSGLSRDAASLKRTLSACEENFPTVVPVLLDVVRGPDHLPADEELQEMLRGKLCMLQADSTEVNTLFMELSAHLISINSERKAIFVTFTTVEEIWKFTTYYKIGFLRHCMESLLLDEMFWLNSLEDDFTIQVSIQEETLNLFYKGILMQEGSLFASCSASQMFDSSTSGGDLYLEQGDIAQFEPPFLGSGWTVLCLADGARGTAPKPALAPVIPFHQWFLKSCAESILVGDGKSICDFPLHFARGTCLATKEYDAEGPDELSMAPGDRIVIVGLLVPCFDWFTGRKEATGEVGLVKTSLVKPSPDTCNSAEIFLDGEDWIFCSPQEEKVIEESTAVLKTQSQNDTEHKYKLGVVLNMRGVALRCMGDLRRAAESYQAAIDICQEYEDMPNWAVAQANLGLLCLKAGAKTLAERHLCEAVQLFSELSEEGSEVNFITVLLELGQYYVNQQQLSYGKGCYEWALLLAINANLLECQLSATRCLCHLYEYNIPNQAQCIIYSQHQVQLLRGKGDRRKEGEVLEAVSQLYLSLGTKRAYQAALDHTKTSLGIFIDLGCKEKEAYGWLQAGKIYQLLGQIELVDIYVQAAQDVALSTGETSFILKLLEAAGDIFFNSCQDRDKAIIFYRDRALPIAVKSSSIRSRLRLCNKLTEVMLSLRLYEEAVEFAQIAVDISKTLGERLNEQVAHHRLASLYHCLEQYELAEHYYLKTLTLCPTPLQFDEETLYYVKVYQTLGDIIFSDLKDPFDAAGYYHLALAAAMDLGNKKSQLQLCTRLATIYHNFIIDRELSLFFYQKARGFAAELNVRRINISPDQQYGSTSQYKTTGP
ncbi:SH3 domain and tetratricopeptide repeat-containing protein 1 isoform X2 [Archocentrus centrarchus]|uniref:SH3 domain and tetratricopeptide repeat-containing protein 1 isoform X2 n=1 Tax=Archocentrus centrarchus TaxID=63155 RepID=UPI0011E9B6BE|nr:SH3 domain and tetratricopeptide repeat-containing protein 1 isoform X2 [Archocentrus centrarchus]